MKRPNVLLITADQLRWDALSCYGNPVAPARRSATSREGARTPNLDRLAASGVRFEKCMTPNPICVPARASITTGLYPHKCTGRKTNSGMISRGPKIAEVFDSAGYETYAIGKLHYVPYAPPDEPRLLHGFKYCEICESGRMIRKYDPRGERRGIEDYHDYLHSVGWGGYERAHAAGNNDVHATASPLPAEHCVDSWIATRSIAKLTEHLKGRETRKRPFFMWASSPKPHSPYDPPRPYDAAYDPREVPRPFGCEDGFDEAILEGRDPDLAPWRVHFGWDLMSPEAVQLSRARYLGLVTFQDEQVGRLLGFLEDRGELENTVVVYTADHGDLLGDFGCFFKGSMLEGSVHVPLLMAGPGLPDGAVSGALAGLQDVLPTLAELCGIELVPVDGMSLANQCGPGPGERRVIVSQCLETPRQKYMAFDGRWKYIHCEQGGIEELYDLDSDPAELTNLASEAAHDGKRRELREEVIRFCRDEGDEAALAGDGPGAVLKEGPLPEPPQGFRAGGMGWRWY